MPKRLPSRTQIEAVLVTDDRPWHVGEISKALDVDRDDEEAMVRILDGLVLDGVVSPRPGLKYKLVGVAQKSALGDGLGVYRSERFERTERKGLPRREAPVPSSTSSSSSSSSAQDPVRPPVRRNSDEREGVLSVNPRGFGFVSSIGAQGDDVFIGADALHSAMNGDKVIVRIRNRGPRGAEGEITKILDRGTKRVAGVLRRRGKSAWLEPDDNRVRGPISLPSAMDSSGPEGNSGNDGDAAIVIITRYPELEGENPEGKIDVVLGRPGELRVEIAKILAMAQIQETHSEDAVAEAEAFGITVPEAMLEGREDLTHIPLPTIDPEDARDHDDAVWVERAEDGGYIAWIAIADVSSYVTPGTKLDEEAKARGCSIYLPDRAIPMLPRALSSNLCSLLPDQIRLCLCVEARLDASGKLTGSRVIRGFMKSAAKLTYGGVARALGFSEIPPQDPKADAMVEGLKVAYELSRLLRGRRMKRGALDFDLPEPKIIMDPATGDVKDVTRRSEDAGVKRAYQLIEELMLLANETVATWLVARELPTVFRIHEAPDEKKLEKLSAMCEQLGLDFDVEATRDPKQLQALLKTFAEHKLANVLNMLLLRSMKQAAYDVRNLGHFGLASLAYLHFTSPIRRYPDLVVHRTTHKVALGQKVKTDDDALEELREAALASSVAERKAMEVERDIVDLHRCMLMRNYIGERYEGTVTGLVGSGVFVVLDQPFVDVLIRLEDLGGDSYTLDDDGLFVVGGRSGDRVGLGDKLVVEIIDVAILRRTIYGRRVGGGNDGAENDGSPRGDRWKRPRKVVEVESRGKKPAKEGKSVGAKVDRLVARKLKGKASNTFGKPAKPGGKPPKGGAKGAGKGKGAKGPKGSKGASGKKSFGKKK